MNGRISIVGLALVLLLAGCGREQGGQADMSVVETVHAQTMQLAGTSVPLHAVSSGVVVSDQRVMISSRMSGYIREILVREGDRVKAGQLLFRIDPVDARQAYEQALAHLKDAEADLRRYRSLLADHAVSRQQFEKIKLRYDVARSKLVQAENQLQYAEVKAPVSGVVVEKRASAGDLAAPGRPVLVLENPSQLLVETHVSEQFIDRLHEGDPAEVWVPGTDSRIDGRIRQIVDAADPVTHLFLVKVAIPVTEKVFPGMFAEVRFMLGHRTAVLIPEVAVVHRAGLNGVYLVDRDGVAHYRQVRLGEHHEGKVEVLAGLKPGDVIAWGSSELKTGVHVERKSS